MPLIFEIFDHGLSYCQSQNLQVFPFDVAYYKRTTLEEALPIGPQSSSLYFGNQGGQENGKK